MKPVPFLDLGLQYQNHRAEIDRAIAEVIESSAFIGGRFVERFEKRFAGFCGAKRAVGVANGTCALFLILQALGIGPDDEVILPANTFIATAEAVSACGARVVFADVDPDSYNLDPASCAAMISPQTKAIIPVHLYGQPADMEAFLQLARPRGIAVIEDAAQAHGAIYRGQKVGGLGIAAGFSFYPGKNLGAYGDAGAIVTNDEALADRIAMLRDHGRKAKYLHEIPAYNMRMDGLQGAILDVKLNYLPAWNQARQQIARRYAEQLHQVPGLILPKTFKDREHVFHLFVIQVDRRDQLQQWLKERGIETGIHYPVPLHLQPAYRLPGSPPPRLPVAERLAERILSLPIYPEMKPEQAQWVVEAITEFARAAP